MFGIEVMEASFGLAILISFAGGVVSFLSPCVLPIVPPYLAYMAGSSLDDLGRARRAVIGAALFFVMGLSTVFIIMGMVAASLGQALLMYQREIAIGSGLVIIVFGLHFVGLIRIPFLYREARLDAGDRGGSMIGAYVLGLAFAFGWTPCIGPILSAILSLVAQEASLPKGMATMAAYAVGLGMPFLLAAIFLEYFLRIMTRLRRHMGTVEKVMGGLLIFVGIMMVTGMFSRFSYWLLEAFPSLALIG